MERRIVRDLRCGNRRRTRNGGVGELTLLKSLNREEIEDDEGNHRKKERARAIL